MKSFILFGFLVNLVVCIWMIMDGHPLLAALNGFCAGANAMNFIDSLIEESEHKCE